MWELRSQEVCHFPTVVQWWSGEVRATVELSSHPQIAYFSIQRQAFKLFYKGAPENSPLVFSDSCSLPMSLKKKNYLFVYFWLHCSTCRILVPQSGIEPRPLAVKAQSPNHWIARELPPTYIFESYFKKCFPGCTYKTHLQTNRPIGLLSMWYR